MTGSKISAIKAFLEFLVKRCKVISYGKLARKFNVSIRAILNLLQTRLLALSYVVVGEEGGVYVLSSNKGICDYQLKKLQMPLLPLSEAPNPKKVWKRAEKNSWSLSDLRIIPAEYVYQEEEDYESQTGEEKP